MSVNIWVGGIRRSGIVARQYDESGTAGNTLSGSITAGTVYGISVDYSGNIFLAGNFSISTTYRVVVYNDSLVEQWKSSLGDAGRAITARASLGCYVNFTAPYNAYQFNGSGSDVWSKYDLGNGTGVATDTSDNAYFTHEYTVDSLIKYNSSGTYQWSKNHGGYLRCVAVDGSGNVVVGGDVSSGVSIRKFAADGTFAWNADHGATVRGIAADAAGNVYICGSASGGYTTRKYNGSGSLQWSANHGDTAYGIAVDSSGNVYTVGGGISTDNLVCYDSSGSVQWTRSHGNTLYAIDLAETTPPLALPALAMPLGLGVPDFARSHDLPALDLALALGVPELSAPPAPPVIDAARANLIFRCYLSGGTLLEVPMAFFQCRRRLGDSTWLTVDIPLFSAELWADIKSRGGNRIAIHAGYRAGLAGPEIIGGFIEATLTAWQHDITPFSATVRLTGRVVPTPFSPIARTLIGVSQRGKSGGRRTARAMLDFRIRPHDVIHDGASAWTAGSVTWTVGPGVGTMDVSEA